MKTQFFDRQDPHNPANGRVVMSPAELRALLETMRDRPPFFAELIGDNGFKLLLGLGGGEGCVQFSPLDGSPPYLTTVGSDLPVPGEVMEFLISDTPTPVPRRFCVPYETVLQVADAFVLTGSRRGDVRWEET